MLCQVFRRRNVRRKIDRKMFDISIHSVRVRDEIRNQQYCIWLDTRQSRISGWILYSAGYLKVTDIRLYNRQCRIIRLDNRQCRISGLIIDSAGYQKVPDIRLYTRQCRIFGCILSSAGYPAVYLVLDNAEYPAVYQIVPDIRPYTRCCRISGCILDSAGYQKVPDIRLDTRQCWIPFRYVL